MLKKINKIQAFILCGGLGSRLKSLTKNNQKVMVAVNQRPFLDILISYLKKQGIQNIVLCVGYKSDLVKDYYKKNSQGLDIVFSEESTPLGTGGAIKNAKSFLRRESFFVFNGDSFCSISLNLFERYFQRNKALGCLAVAKVKESRDFGSIVLNKKYEIVDFKEKKKGANVYVNAGIYCFSKDIFNFMPNKKKFSLETDFFPGLIGKNFFGFVANAPFYDIGTPQRYAYAQKILKNRGEKSED